MGIFAKIKSDINKKIEEDRLKEKSNDNIEDFSLKQLFNGRILLHPTVIKAIPMILVLLALSMVYIQNRFDYEALIKTNNELKEEQYDLQTTDIVKNKKFKELATREAILRKLSENGSRVSEPNTPPIVVSE